MTREEAIDFAEFLKSNWLINFPDMEKFCDMAIEALQAEPKAKCIARIEIDPEEVVKRIKEEYDITDVWIPCSERLPNEYAQYLVCFEDGECYVYWLEDSDWARGMVEKEGIIAWMPLPMPYREDDE